MTSPSKSTAARTAPDPAPTSTVAPALRMNGVRKTFRQPGAEPVVAVDSLDLTIRPGEIVAFLGPNGAGKTTALDMVLGFTEPDAGTIEVYGAPPRAAIEAGRISAVLQTGGLLNDFTVAETVRVIAALHGGRGGGHVLAPEEAMERAGITHLGSRKVSKCSGGEQQRLKFALALLPDPDLIVLDEPTAGMDVTARQEFWTTMQADAASGRTIIFATHYLAEADTFAERTVLMARGRVVADGATHDVRARFGTQQLSFTPPTDALRDNRIDEAWLARVRDALAPYGVDDLHVAAASLEAAFTELTRAQEETNR